MYPENAYALYRRRISEIDTLRCRSQWLSEKDKTLMQMVFDKGSTFGQIAHLTGENPGTVSRRFHRLLGKLITKQLLPLLRAKKGFNSRDLRIIQDYYLKGQTQKSLARKFNTSLYHVRTTLQAARAIAAAFDHTQDSKLSRSTVSQQGGPACTP